MPLYDFHILANSSFPPIAIRSIFATWAEKLIWPPEIIMTYRISILIPHPRYPAVPASILPLRRLVGRSAAYPVGLVLGNSFTGHDLGHLGKIWKHMKYMWQDIQKCLLALMSYKDMYVSFCISSCTFNRLQISCISLHFSMFFPDLHVFPYNFFDFPTWAWPGLSRPRMLGRDVGRQGSGLWHSLGVAS